MKKSPAPKTFEEAIKRLETLTQSMQNSEMPLEEALAAYQEGNELVKYCQTKLAEVEQKLQVLDADGLKELTLNADEGTENLAGTGAGANRTAAGTPDAV